MTFRRALVFFGAVGALLARHVRADEVGPAMPSNPAAVEAAVPVAPITVRQDDAERILSRAPPPTEAAPPPAAPAGRTEEFAVDPSPVVNRTPRFVFVDDTKRTATRGATLAERQRAAEAVRQSFRKPGSR